MRNRIKFIQALVEMVALRMMHGRFKWTRIGREEWAMVSGRFSWVFKQFKPLQL
jgi:hypothetical protein